MFTCVSIDPDTTNLVSATKSTVSLTGYCDQREDDDSDAEHVGGRVLTLGRKLWFAALNEWLDEKSRYCAGGECLGEGFIIFDDVELLPQPTMLTYLMVEPPPAGIDRGSPEFAELASRKLPIPTYGATRRTEFYVEMDSGSEPVAP